MRVWTLLCWVALASSALATSALATSAEAAPQLAVKAKTSLALEKVRLRGDGTAEVIGQLSDKLTGEGLRGQTVTIRVGDAQVVAATGPDGTFRADVVIPEGPQPVLLRFRGGPQLDNSDFTTITDPTRAQVHLAILVDDVPGGAKIVVTATADDQPTRLSVQLAVGAPTANELAPLQAIETGAPFVLTRKAAGGAGPRRVRAFFAGDPARQPASTETTLELTATTATSISLTATTVAYEDDLGVTGKVTDEDGAPVPHAAVALTAGDRRLAQGATGVDGTYKFRVEAAVIGEGAFVLQVQADPGTPYNKASRSDPVTLRIHAPQPVPVSYTVAAFLATVLAAGGFFLARSKPWQRLRRQAPPADVPSDEDAPAPNAGGLVLAKPSLVSTLRRAADDGLSGVVRDTVRGRPIGQAVVRLLLGELEREVRTTADGGFTLEKLVVGEWVAEVVAPGHVTEKFGVSIPHRGELRGVRIDLVPVRERVFQLYRRAAEPVLPEARLWGIWSPRQIVDHVRSKRPSPALADLTDFVEEVYFSSRLTAEAVLPNASERVDRAIRERTGPAIAPPGV